MIKAVIFDLDHTLFDRHSTLKSLVPRLREEFEVNSELSDEKILQKSFDELKSKGKNLCFTVEREYIEEENTAQLILTDFS